MLPHEEASSDTVYYWDDATQTYYYWDASIEAYVAWVDDATLAQPPKGSPNLPPSPATEKTPPLLKHPGMRGMSIELQKEETTTTPVPESAHKEAQLDALAHELAAGTGRAKKRRNTVRLLATKVEQTEAATLAEQLQVLSKAREKVTGDNVATVDEIAQRRKEDEMRRLAREKAGIFSDPSSEDDVERNVILESSSDSSDSSSDAIIEAPPKARMDARRSTARFGTAHFSNKQTAADLEKLLARKVK